jgi:hypothetical protein
MEVDAATRAAAQRARELESQGGGFMLPIGVIFLLVSAVMTACAKSRGPAAPPSHPAGAPAATASQVDARCPSPMPARRAAPPPAWPATWRVHPRRADLLQKLADLDHGQQLYLDFEDHPWFFDPKTGFQRAAASACSAIGGFAGKEWTFVAHSGATCSGPGPLGPLTQAFEPGERLVAVTLGSRIVAVRGCGALVVSDDAGASYRSVGPTDVKFVDVVAQLEGKLVARAEPKQSWLSSDGIAWTRVDDAAKIVPLRRNLTVPGFNTRPRLGPSGDKLWNGEAAWFDEQYFEIDGARRNDRPTVWVLRGTLKDGFREQERGDFTTGCGLSKVSGFGNWVYAACAGSRIGDDEVRIYVSSDHGDSFRLEPYTLRAKFDELRLAAGADGALVLSGACEGARCEPDGIFHRERAGRRIRRVPRAQPIFAARAPFPRPKKPVQAPPPPVHVSGFDLFASAAPPFAGPLLWLGATPDGKRFAGVATTLGNQQFVVLRSSDGGKTFTATPLPELVPSIALKLPRKATLLYHGVNAAAYDDLGNVTLVIHSSSIVMVTHDGQVSIRKAQHGIDSLGVYGPRVLALDTGASRGWESLDAGTTWRSVAVPKFPCPSMLKRCSFAQHCTHQLCFIGDDYTRTAWEVAR